jgi:hypothetical protein
MIRSCFLLPFPLANNNAKENPIVEPATVAIKAVSYCLLSSINAMGMRVSLASFGVVALAICYAHARLHGRVELAEEGGSWISPFDESDQVSIAEPQNHATNSRNLWSVFGSDEETDEGSSAIPGKGTHMTNCSIVEHECDLRHGGKGVYVCRKIPEMLQSGMTRVSTCIEPSEAEETDKCGCCGYGCTPRCPCPCSINPPHDPTAKHTGWSMIMNDDPTFNRCVEEDALNLMITGGRAKCDKSCESTNDGPKEEEQTKDEAIEKEDAEGVAKKEKPQTEEPKNEDAEEHTKVDAKKEEDTKGEAEKEKPTAGKPETEHPKTEEHKSKDKEEHKEEEHTKDNMSNDNKTVPPGPPQPSTFPPTLFPIFPCNCTCELPLESGEPDEFIGDAMFTLDASAIEQFLNGDPSICVPKSYSIDMLLESTAICDETCRL